MTQKTHRHLTTYCKLEDLRGGFDGIINHGRWEEVNIVTSLAKSVRGGHFHRDTTEIIFMLSGKADVELAHCECLDQIIRLTLNAGEGLEIYPLTVHTFHYLVDSSHLQLLNARFDSAHPDLVARSK